MVTYRFSVLALAQKDDFPLTSCETTLVAQIISQWPTEATEMTHALLKPPVTNLNYNCTADSSINRSFLPELGTELPNVECMLHLLTIEAIKLNQGGE